MKRKVLIIAGLCLLLVGCGSQPKGASVSESKDTTTIEENSIVDTASGVVEDSQSAEALEDTQKSEVSEEPAKVHYTDDEGFSCNFHININGIEVELNGDELTIRDKTYTGVTEYEAKMLKNTFKQYRNTTGNNYDISEAKGEVLRVAESIAEQLVSQGRDYAVTASDTSQSTSADNHNYVVNLDNISNEFSIGRDNYLCLELYYDVWDEDKDDFVILPDGIIYPVKEDGEFIFWGEQISDVHKFAEKVSEEKSNLGDGDAIGIRLIIESGVIVSMRVGYNADI